MSPLAILIVALVVVVGGVLAFRMPAFLTLIVGAFVVAALTPPSASTPPPGSAHGPPAATASPTTGELIPPGRRVAEGFGRTALDIGIVIAMASILGCCLTAAGGAEKIVMSIQSALGTARTPLALLMTGFLLGIPMFAETVFFLLLPLARASWDRTGRHYLLNVLAIIAGATMTHSLVPPTPGPLFVADAFGIDMTTMIACGLVVGGIAALAGYAYAAWADRTWPLEPRDAARDEQTEAAAARPARSPSLPAALAPILLPMLLITLGSIAEAAPQMLPAGVMPAIRVCGEKNTAMALSALLSIGVLCSTVADMATVRRTITEAITEAGEIILVIAAGGALGGALRQAGMAELSHGFASGSGIALIPIAWAITAVIRVAQGSATVAMITAAGVLAPIVAADGLGFHPVYVAMAIGCGSKAGMWMNDSGFWVIARMSGMTEPQTLRSASAMVMIEGVAGLAATLALASLWPMQP
jgi:GntP family gluconate:H+ symporter